MLPTSIDFLVMAEHDLGLGLISPHRSPALDVHDRGGGGIAAATFCLMFPKDALAEVHAVHGAQTLALLLHVLLEMGGLH